MDWSNVVIAICTAVGTIISIVTILNRKFEKIESNFTEVRRDLRSLDSRISRIEGILEVKDMKREGTHDK
jgi:hypothetical protein